MLLAVYITSSFIGFNPGKQVGLVELCSCEGVDMPL
jgi:hypothetical protein